MNGIIDEIKPVIKNSHLKIIAKVKVRDNNIINAYLPDREVAAILPRKILIGEDKKVPATFLKTISPIVSKVSCGRQVRLWEYNGLYYFSFLSWRNVIFVSKLMYGLKPDMVKV
jgi:hypothetical protein